MKCLISNKVLWILSFELLFFSIHSGYSQEKNTNKALLVLDVQKHFTQNVLAPNDAEILILNLNKLIANSEYNHIIYVQSIMRTLNISLSGFYVDTLLNLEFDERLSIVNNNIFTKTKANAFTNQELNKYINSNNIEEVDIAGLLGEECIYHTAVGGLKKELKVNLLKDAIAWKSPKSTEKTCNNLSKKGVNLINIESVY